jgi:hypothetical protein
MMYVVILYLKSSFDALKALNKVFCRSFVEMMGLIGAGNNPMVGMTVAVAVAVQEALAK